MSNNETQRKWRSSTDKKPVQLYLTNEVIGLLDSLVSSTEKASRATIVSDLIKLHVVNDKKLHVDLEQFAKQVQIIIDNMTPDKGHGIRVYISDAHKHFIDMPMDAFKSALLDCHKARYLTLCNANDGEQRSNEKGQQSEIKNNAVSGVNYHFIRQTEQSKLVNGYDKTNIIKAITPFIKQPMAARDELNRLGYTTEEGKKWTGASIKKWIKVNY